MPQHRERTTCTRADIGQYAVQSIESNDLPPILGVTLLAAFFVVIANLLVDLLYAAADPRVRLS